MPVNPGTSNRWWKKKICSPVGNPTTKQMGWKVCDKWKENPLTNKEMPWRPFSTVCTSYRSSPLLLFDTTCKFFLKHSLFTGMNTNFTNKLFLMLHFYSFSLLQVLHLSSPTWFHIFPKPSYLSSFSWNSPPFLVMECMFLSLFLILSSHVLGYDLFLISFFL